MHPADARSSYMCTLPQKARVCKMFRLLSIVPLQTAMVEKGTGRFLKQFIEERTVSSVSLTTRTTLLSSRHVPFSGFWFPRTSTWLSSCSLTHSSIHQNIRLINTSTMGFTSDSTCTLKTASILERLKPILSDARTDDDDDLT